MFVLWAVGMGFLFFTRETEPPQDTYKINDYTGSKSASVGEYRKGLPFAGRQSAKKGLTRLPSCGEDHI